MPIFIQENQELKNNSYTLPKRLRSHLNDTLHKMGQYKQSQGYKRLNTLITPNYNNKTSKDKSNSGYKVSFGDLKRILHDFKNIKSQNNNIAYELNGGEDMERWVTDTLNRERTRVQPVLQQKKVATRNANSVKPTLSPTKPISIGDVSATVHENNEPKKLYIRESKIFLLENDARNPFFNELIKYLIDNSIDQSLFYKRNDMISNIKCFTSGLDVDIPIDKDNCIPIQRTLNVPSHNSNMEPNEYYEYLIKHGIEYTTDSMFYPNIENVVLFGRIHISDMKSTPTPNGHEMAPIQGSLVEIYSIKDKNGINIKMPHPIIVEI